MSSTIVVPDSSGSYRPAVMDLVGEDSGYAVIWPILLR